MSNDHRRLVLVVDTDRRFIDATYRLLGAHRVLSALSLDEAREIVLGGRVDLVLLGPAFGSDVAISQAQVVLTADPTIQVALAADVITNRLLKAALKVGLVDVLDVPLTEVDLGDLIDRIPSAPRAVTEVELIIEPAAPAEQPVPTASQPPSVPTAQAASNFASLPGSEASRGRHAADPGFSVSKSPRVPVPPALPFEPPMSVPTPAEVTFVAEPAPARRSEWSAEEVAPTAPERDEEPFPIEPVVDIEQPPADVEYEAPPAWPDEPAAEAAPPPAAEESLPPELPPPPPPVPSAPKDPSQTWSPPPPLAPDDVLDQVMPPPPSQAPPGAAPDADPFGIPVPDPAVATEAAPAEAAPPTHAVAPGSGEGRVIAVMAGKGGSGKTITATNLAIAIGLRSDPKRVAIVDADLQFGDVALMLQIDPVRTLDDVVGRVDQMSDEQLEAALLRHESGIKVLPAPLLPVRAGEIDAKSVIEVVGRLRAIFDTVVVDTGSVFDEGLVGILEHADHVITVVDMDLPSVKNAKVALDGLRRSGFDMGCIRLVVNRVNSKARLDLVELERSLGLRVGGSIPSDRLVPQSVNEGIPVLALSPRSKVARSFYALAEALDPGLG